MLAYTGDHRSKLHILLGYTRDNWSKLSYWVAKDIYCIPGAHTLVRLYRRSPEQTVMLGYMYRRSEEQIFLQGNKGDHRSKLPV
jgi:hypothetical protein